MIEDLMEEDEDFARELRLKYTGMEFGPSGDPVIDNWERQLAQGQVPNLDIGDDERSRKRDELVKRAAKRHYMRTGERLFKARLPETVELAEALRVGKDSFQFDAADYMAGHGGAEEGNVDSSDVSPEAVDRFLNAAGLIKKK